MSRLSAIPEGDYDIRAEHLETVVGATKQQRGPDCHRRSGLVRSGRLQLDAGNGPQALMVVRNLDHNLPLHAVARLRAADIIPGRVEAAARNLEGLPIWIDEQDIMTRDQETRDDLEGHRQYPSSPSNRLPLRELSAQEVAVRSNVKSQNKAADMEQIQGAQTFGNGTVRNKENRCPSIHAGRKPLSSTM
ncbi:hypothetical protein LTR78_004504 [Recurvomyces mirabilis]|uniref:Uncharacterized protein n=1 Tax=Recurvomyces mirabilis TaxID=574656 RepID=A0AAE0WPB8_9PEZI|nr:hypothetical protein LTR78_004504 [Recurvomyces mirabilis]KAK5153003.1 hypothetical protein LTS14_008111 [Recurvomyces mirabilis]